MSLKNLQHANIRRYIEEKPMTREARIYCEARPTFEAWEKDARELLGLWVTETTSTGERRIDKDRPDLDPFPEFKIQYTESMGARTWVNVCCTDAEDYNRIIQTARTEAAYTLEQKAKWKDYTSKDELTGTIDEVAPAAIREITAKFNH